MLGINIYLIEYCEGIMSKSIKCKICGFPIDNHTFIIKEMMIGRMDKFEYIECPHCKSLQLIEIPEDMSEYYNQNYYSMGKENNFYRFILYHLNRHYLEKDFLGKLFNYFVDGNEKIFKLMNCLLRNDLITYNSQILDIGCGEGTFLQELSDLGFDNLDGMEPFIEKQINNENFTIFKSFLDDFYPKKQYDLIFLKDSLEHMDNPYQNLLNVKRLLKDDGYMIISIPVKTDYFWSLYGVNWFQLDAPRHFVTFTLDGFKILLKSLNLEIEKLYFNSNVDAFIISEDYSKGVSMYSDESFTSKSHFQNVYNKNFKKIDFQSKKVSFRYLKKLIDDLNEKQESEHAIFLIKKT